ncbi:MAG: hypothetical protein E7623_07395, partial [Ruminococcaceae bacterium]|nr:hypothetical protein [Oscillospiraceae bacterium]
MNKIFKRLLCFAIALVLTVAFLVSCSDKKKNAVMVYGDVYITEEMFSYWMSYYKTNLLRNYNSSLDTDEFWDGEMEDGQTVEKMTSEWAHDYIKSILVGMYHFDKNGLSISDELYSLIDQDIREKISSYGTKAELNTFLSTYGINTDILKEIY